MAGHTDGNDSSTDDHLQGNNRVDFLDKSVSVCVLLEGIMEANSVSILIETVYLPSLLCDGHFSLRDIGLLVSWVLLHRRWVLLIDLLLVWWRVLVHWLLL